MRHCGVTDAPTPASAVPEDWRGPLTFLFRAPGVPPWPVFDPSQQPVGWVHPPGGTIQFGPKTLTLADRWNRPSLSVTQRGGLSGGGYRVLDAAGAELGMLRLTGVSGLETIRIEAVASVTYARLETDLDALRDGAAAAVDHTGAPLVRLALGDDPDRAWFMLRWEREPPAQAVPLLLALPLALHTEYEERSAFRRRNRDVGDPRRPDQHRWPHL